ncbi:MAG: hypothetical protein IT454_02955 [Planctomycetes bacterium]|nr:hypothetical protein [Planctomycetota bacterium]
MNATPEPQLPFDSAREPRPSARVVLGTVGSRAVFWAPVWVPLALLAQVSIMGLGPALAERRRLDAAERALEERLERERATGSELERTLRAQQDPIYLERERRLLQSPDGPLRVK